MLTGEAKKQATREAVKRYRDKKKGITVIPPEDVIPCNTPLKLADVIPPVIPGNTPEKDVTPAPDLVIPGSKAQKVERRSPKPEAVGSTPATLAKIGYGLPFGKDVQSRGGLR